MLKVLTLSTLYPNAARPDWGVFVGRQTAELARSGLAHVQVVNPVGVPPAILRALPAFARYRALADLPRETQRDGVTVHHVPFPLLPGIGWRRNPAAIVRTCAPVLRRLRADFAFDVIDAEFFFPCGVAAARLGRALGVPVSIKARGSDIHLWSQQPAARRMILEAGQAAGGLLAVSAALKRDMAALGLPDGKITVHYTGVDLSRFQPLDRAEARAALGLPAGPLLVSVGALIPLKGHALAIEALTDLPGVTLAIAGDGPERANLQSLAARLGVADRVRLLGHVSHGDIPRLLAAGDAMVLASEREGLANAWVEALACGTPIIITDVGGAREVVDRPAAGIVLGAHTPSAIAEAARTLLASPPLRAETAQAAQCFTWTRNSTALAAHLLGIL